MQSHKVPTRLATVGTLIGVLFMFATGVAQANTATVTASVSSPVSTARAISVGVLGFSLGVPKVSSPSLVVSVSSDRVTPTVVQKIHSAPTTVCAAADNPAAGYLNRTITVTLAGGTTSKLYAHIQFDTTSAAGHSNHVDIEPFGAAPGLSVTSPAILGLLPPLSIPVALCVS